MVKISNNTKGNVNITTKNGIGVNLTSNNDTDVNANMNGNAQRAKSWAVGEGLIDGVDYSAKYYAQEAKESEDIASHAIENIDTAKEQALSAIDTEKTEAIADMETAKEEKISEIEDTAAGFEDDLEALTTRAETAATNAETSETNAATSATSAENSSIRARNFATDAGNYVVDAENARDVAVQAKENALTAKTAAEDAQAQAEMSASNARDYEQSAYNNANAASNSATRASQSASMAATARDVAEIARDAAEGYAQQAEAAKDDIEAELDNYVPNTRKVNNKPLSTDITLTASDIGALANTTKYGYSVALSLDTTNYKLTLTLKDQGGTALSTKTVDFPIESVVVNGSYDSTNKKIVLTLQSGSTIDIPVGDLISGLQSEITSTNKLDSDLVDDTSSSHKFATAAQLNQIATNTSSISNLATVATSGSYNDLTNKPTIPTVNNATLTIQKNGTTVKTFTANASSNVTCNITVPTAVTDLSDASNYVLSSSLATVATSGSYNDLSNKPTIPTDTNDLTNGAGFITSSALSPYALSSSLATVATSGSYNDLADKPYIPSGVVVDQTYDGTSANAQSGVAIAGELANYVIVNNSDAFIDNGGTYVNCGYKDNDYAGELYIDDTSAYLAFDDTQNGYHSEVTVGPEGVLLSYNYQGVAILDSSNNDVAVLTVSNNNLAVNGSEVALKSDIPDNEVFVAEYGDTSFADVLAAYNAGKTIKCIYIQDAALLTYYLAFYDGSYFVFMSEKSISQSDDIQYAFLELDSDDNWTNWKKENANTTLSNVSSIASSSAVATALDGKADTELSNLSSTGKTVIDGQWVYDKTTIANGARLTTTAQPYDISSYLPNDSYDYEVLFGAAVTSGSSTGNRVYLTMRSDISSWVEVAYAQAQRASSTIGYGNCIIAVGTGRTVTVSGISNPNNSTFQLMIEGYRRIGTNT